LFLAFAVSSFLSCIRPNSGNLSSGTETDFTDNQGRALGMDKETFAREFAKELASVVKSMNACPSFQNPDKLLILEQSKFFGFIPRGSRMDINTSDKRTIGSIDAPFGSAFAGRGSYYTFQMTNETGKVTSYARFKKTGLDENFQLDYMTPPEVEVFSCNASEDALRNSADTGQLPIYRFRINSVNGSRLIKATFTFRTLMQLFAPVCGRSERLRNVLGQSCDSYPVHALAAVPKDKRMQLDPDAQNDDRVYASMGLTKDRQIKSVMTVSKDAKTIKIRRLQNETEPSESPPDGVSLAEIKQTESSLVGLWLPYFFRAEQHLESYNSNLDAALGLAVDLTIGLVPGGKYLGEGVWKLAEEALSKGAESVRQEKLQSNPNSDDGTSAPR
jgi:hypothetical protein